MIISLFIACMLGIVSIFCFFGSVFSFQLDLMDDVWQSLIGRVPNMFDLSLGINGYSNFGGLTFLFVFQILIMIYCVFVILYTWYMVNEDSYYLENNENTVYAQSIILGIASLIAMIVSFCTLPIVFGDSSLDYGSYITLGEGPILYSIFQIVIIIVLSIGIFYHIKTERYQIKTARPSSITKVAKRAQSTYKKFIGEDATSNILNASINKPSSVVKKDIKYCKHCDQQIEDDYVVCPNCGKPIEENKPLNASINTDHENKIDLLNKYYELYTKSILSEEEFNKIKSKILNDID